LYLESKDKAAPGEGKIGRRRLGLKMSVPSKGRDGYYEYQESEEKIVHYLEREIRRYLESKKRGE
jgi:hypothetical protein